MKRSILFLALFILMAASGIAQVAINTDAGNPNVDAMLDVKSSNKGLLIPRLALTGTTDVAPLANHVAGMLVYNTATAGATPNKVTPGFYYNDGTKWIKIGNSENDGDWIIDGNSMASAVEGNVGIGTGLTAPGATLDVRGRIWQTGTGKSVFLGEDAGSNDNLSDNLNSFVGYHAGKSNSIGELNTALGYQSLTKNTSGQGNTAIGANSLFTHTEGFYNTATGLASMYSTTTGFFNTAVGAHSLHDNQDGNYNIAMGGEALFSNISASSNTAIGYSALRENKTGTENVALGYQAGQYYGPTGSNANISGKHNVFIGSQTRAFADGTENEIIIGNQAIGIGSNSVVLGSISIATTALRGNVGIGTTNPGEKLDINGAMHLTPGSAPTTANEGDIYMDSSTHKLRCYDGSTWHDLW